MYKIFLQKKNKRKETGFTLVESLIAITILMISVAAPLNLAGKGLVAADLAQRQIIAFYLAQDAAETIINLKTTNKLNLDGIMHGMNGNVTASSDCTGTNGCAIDTVAATVQACVSANCATRGRLYKSTNGVYTHTAPSGNFSGFTRYVKMQPITVTAGVDEEVEVITTVWWLSSTGDTQTYTLKNNIANW